MDSDLYAELAMRSSGRCEMMIYLERYDVWTRCGRGPVQIHHMLKRSRGGRLLDEVGETYHLIAVCPKHHQWIETSGEETGALIDGYVVTDHLTGKPVYTGSNTYLRNKYGESDDNCVDEPADDCCDYQATGAS